MPKNSHPHITHIRTATDLLTPYANTRAGFVQMALERNHRASPYVAEARDLNAQAVKASTPLGLLKIAGIRAALLTAAGISDKASGHMDEQGRDDAITGLIRNYLDGACGQKLSRRACVPLSPDTRGHIGRLHAQCGRTFGAATLYLAVACAATQLLG